MPAPDDKPDNTSQTEQNITPPVSRGGARPPSPRTRLLIITAVIAIILLGGALFLLFRAVGGDDPAPQLETTTDTASETDTTDGATTETGAATAAARASQSQSLPPLDLRRVNWDRELEPGLYGAFLEPVIYSDLTGDGSDEAIVRVRYEGSGSTLDYYVYGSEQGKLKTLYADGNLNHGQVNLGIEPGSFVVTEAFFQPGDPVCCPSRTLSTTFIWIPGLQEFQKTAESESMTAIPALQDD